ncbi:MAG TPA: serine/threonine-protein kinase, partial [Vicinamibacterales bacterium]
MTLSAGAQLGPYEVVRLLGTGGMGDVYLAYDPRLARQVALKCPSDAWLKTDEARARLQSEARAAARLTHAHIAAVHDVLESGGRPFIVMEYVEGESLSAALARGHPSLERGLEMGLQLVDALTAAHAAGVIHRDLKPGNVMLTPDGQIKVLDFGLAKTADVDPAIGPLTRPGEVMVTPAYAAPEQLMGCQGDARSDVYSAGAILYELFGGRPLWKTPSPGHLLDAVCSPLPELSTIDPSVPRDVSAVVARAMALDPAHRFASAAELGHALATAAHQIAELPTMPMRALRRMRPFHPAAVVFISIFAAIAAGVPLARHWRSGDAPVRPRGAPPVVAILPLENLSPDPGASYLGAGMAETMSTKLAAVPGIAVVSRAEVHAALNRRLDPAKLARVLGATYLVTGSIQVTGERLQVTINLLNADDRRVLDGAVFQDSQKNLFALQRRIAEELTKEIVGTLSTANRDRLLSDPTASVDALAEYWRGRELLERPGPGPIEPAIAAFTRAVSLDGNFAPAYAGLGSAYWRKYQQVKEPEWAHRAAQAAKRARQLDADDPEVRFALAEVYRQTGEPAKAIAELK